MWTAELVRMSHIVKAAICTDTHVNFASRAENRASMQLDTGVRIEGMKSASKG
jgi:hypothetical protein